MRIRSFIIACALVLGILLFADRRPGSIQPDRYSRIVDLTDGQNATERGPTPDVAIVESQTRIIAPAALIPGTWAAGQIPPERLIAPLVVMDLPVAAKGVDSRSAVAQLQISLDDIAAWEVRYGMIPQGAVIAIRGAKAAHVPPASDLSRAHSTLASTSLPIARDAAMFLIESRNTIGFAVETPVTFTSDRALARQLALHGNYVVEQASRFTSLPTTGSLVVVAPAKNKKPGAAPVRVLAMVR
jgi:kynurenine formamidase